MTSGPGTLDERYLTWLYRNIGTSTRNPARSYWLLAVQLYQKPFEWFVHNDDNRAADGLELRDEFILEENEQPTQAWMEEDCSMLEMLIALSRRIAFQTDGDPYEWFWQMMQNLDLRPYVDEQYDDEVRILVDDVLETVIRRTYRRDGVGGLFPLRHADVKDQRKVEIAYQMASYLLESG